MTGTQKLHGCSPAEALVRMQNTIRSDIGITVSIGLSGTKSLAKMASDRDKPDGFFTIGMAEAADWLAPQSVWCCSDLVNRPLRGGATGI